MPSDLAFVVDIIKQHWQPGKKILEVGCGPALLRKYFGADYVGSDVTNEPYNAAMLRDVDVVCAAEDLQFPDKSMDVVIIKSALYLFADPRLAINEACRVLRPHGKLIVFDYNKKTQKNLQRKEGHSSYPCWTSCTLAKLLRKAGFSKPRAWVATDKQPTGLARLYQLFRQEFFGTWAIISASKGNS